MQKTQTTFILKSIISASEGFSRLVSLSSFTSLSIFDMILVIVGAKEHDCSSAPSWCILGSIILARTWVLFFYSFVSPLLGVFFNGMFQGFINERLQLNVAQRFTKVIYFTRSLSRRMAKSLKHLFHMLFKQKNANCYVVLLCVQMWNVWSQLGTCFVNAIHVPCHSHTYTIVINATSCHKCGPKCKMQNIGPKIYYIHIWSMQHALKQQNWDVEDESLLPKVFSHISNIV